MMFKKILAILITVSLLSVSTVALADYNISLNFDLQNEYENIFPEIFSVDTGVGIEQKDGYIVMNGTSINTGITYNFSETVKDDIVDVSFKVNKTTQTNFKVLVNDTGAIAIFKSGTGVGRFFAYLPNTKYAHFNKNSNTYFPCDNKWAKITLSYDLKNRRLRVFENDIETAYIIHEGNGTEEWNDGKYIDSGISEINKISFTVNGSVSLDEISIHSQIADTIKKAENATDKEEATEIYKKLLEYADLGYNISEYMDFIYNYVNISSEKYTVDYTKQEISGIEYSTDINDFISALSVKSEITAYVDREGVKVSDGSVKNGDILVVGEEMYVLKVAAASTNCIVESDTYTVNENSIEGVYYGTSISDFKKNISIDKYAVMSFSLYNEDYNGNLDSDFVLTITAQSGDVKEYSVILEENDDYDVVLESDEYNIDNAVHTIKLDSDSVRIDDFKGYITAALGEKMELLDKQFNKKLYGTVNGSEILRVYKVGSKYGEYVDYTVNVLESNVIDMDYNDSRVQKSGQWYNSTVGTGMNGLYPIYGANDGATMTFNYTAEATGVLEVYVYTVYYKNNSIADKITISQGSTQNNIVLNHAVPTGFQKLEELDVNVNDDIKVEFCGQNGLMKITGVRFLLRQQEAVEDIELIKSDDRPQIIINTADFVDTSATDISKLELFSENGNKVDIDCNVIEKKIIVTPKKPIKSYLKYNFVVCENALKGIDRKNVSTQKIYNFSSFDEDAFASSTSIGFIDENGKKLTGPEGAKAFSVAYKTVNLEKQLNGIKICAVAFDNGKMIDIKTEDSQNNGYFVEEMNEKMSKNGKIKIFFTDANEIPIIFLN